MLSLPSDVIICRNIRLPTHVLILIWDICHLYPDFVSCILDLFTSRSVNKQFLLQFKFQTNQSNSMTSSGNNNWSLWYQRRNSVWYTGEMNYGDSNWIWYKMAFNYVLCQKKFYNRKTWNSIVCKWMKPNDIYPFPDLWQDLGPPSIHLEKIWFPTVSTLHSFWINFFCPE